MPNPITCPDAHEYERLRRGEMSLPEVDQLAQHIEKCGRCADRVERLSINDTLIEALRAQSTVTDPKEKDRVSDLMARLKQFRLPANLEAEATAAESPVVPALTPMDNTCELYSFLAPPQGAGEIGRLGPYRVLKELGTGGMGVVFQAEDVKLKRLVALKAMRPAMAASAGAGHRFQREAEATAAIKHDHIVTIYQVGEDRGVPFLAMEYLEGMSLDDWLKKGRAPTLTQAARIGRQIALGLAEAHACGLIHRDIKPGNVWLDSRHQGRVKLLDFGLARGGDDDHQLTQSGAIVGTPAYMAPEQARGEKVDHRVDLFSLGVVLYRLTTGRLPFRGENTMSVLTALALDTPTPPREITPDISPRMAALIERLLSKDRAQRPATAKAVAVELAAIEREQTPANVPVEQASHLGSPEECKVQEASGRRQPAVGSGNSRLTPAARRWLVAVGLLLLGGVAAAIVVIIRDKDGKEVARVPVPDGGHVEIKEDTKGKTPGGAPAKPDSKPVTKTDQRQAVEWVLSIGGRVDILAEEQNHVVRKQVAALKDLPMGKWEVDWIGLSSNQKVTDTGLAHLEGLTGLTGIGLDGTKVGDAGLEHLKGLTNLKRLGLPGTKVSDAGMAHLKQLTNLTHLYFTGTKVGDAGLEHLKGLTNLEDLWLAGTKVSDAGLEHLKGLTSLTMLRLDGTNVSDAGLEHLKGLTSLTLLRLDGTKVGDAGLEHLKGLTKLSYLNLTDTTVGDAGMAQLEGLTKLTFLSLEGTKVSDAGLEHLKGLTKLRDLWLAGTKVSGTGLACLEGLTNLTSLRLANTNVSDAGLEHLKGLTKLRDLWLTGTKVSGPGLAQLTNLTRLDLEGTKVDDAGLEFLKGLTNLTTLDLVGTMVGDAGLEHLKGLTKLTHLGLRGTKVGDAGLEHLKGLTNLSWLRLQNTKVTAAGCAALRKALPKCNIEGVPAK